MANIIKKTKKIFRTLIIIILPALIFISCSKKPNEVVKEYETAFNTHNVNKITSMFSDSAEIDLSTLKKIKGHDQIKDYIEYDSVLNSQITVSDITDSDGKAYFVMYLKNDLLRSIGIDEVKYSMIFTISDGKIENITGSTTNETDNKLRQFQNPFMKWASKERFDVLNEIMPNGEIIFNAENAKKYLELVLDWKKSEQTTISALPK